MTQRLAYEGARQWNGTKERTATSRNVLRVQDEVAHATRVRPSVESVWSLLRKDPVSRKSRDFVWKALHEGHRVGKFWSNIPGYEDRALCTACGTLESMEHILCLCLAPGQQTAWALARGILKRKGIDLPDVTIGLALGGHTFSVVGPDGEHKHGPTRLARLVLSETAYLIWVLRCERVVGNRAPLAGRLEHDFVERRWMRMVSNRFQLDRTLTNKRVAAQRAVPHTAVLATWEKTLHEEHDLPTDWIMEPGVLVGKPLRLHVLRPG